VRRGEIWWAELPVPRGSEPGHRRPVLIVQAAAFNRSQIQTVVVAAITSNLRLARAPGNIHLPPSESRLAKDSVVNVSQLLTLDRSCLAERVSRIRPKHVEAVDAEIRLVLAV